MDDDFVKAMRQVGASEDLIRRYEKERERRMADEHCEAPDENPPRKKDEDA